MWATLHCCAGHLPRMPLVKQKCMTRAYHLLGSPSRAEQIAATFVDPSRSSVKMGRGTPCERPQKRLNSIQQVIFKHFRPKSQVIFFPVSRQTDSERMPLAPHRGERGTLQNRTTPCPYAPDLGVWTRRLHEALSLGVAPTARTGGCDLISCNLFCNPLPQMAKMSMRILRLEDADVRPPLRTPMAGAPNFGWRRPDTRRDRESCRSPW